MNVSEAVARRRSIRAFLDTPVDGAVLRGVLEAARRAPSGGNVQPWHGVVVAGDPLTALIARVAEAMARGESSADYAVYPPDLPQPYRARRSLCAEEMYGTMGITRDDRPARLAHVRRNFTAFGAPVLLFCHTPRLMGPPQWSDLGMWLQTIMLLLVEAGLDSCAQEAWSSHGGLIRAELGIPDDHVLFCALAIGHADPAAPVNATVTSRAPLDETVRWLG
ncbi:nitroreductase [Novosphingobium bradum]|uniref:Nitroreductase n=1 Tax=Novosphingobium bradum TaxID=1737444 RepID=A0ABV7ILA0_9SPHN